MIGYELMHVELQRSKSELAALKRALMDLRNEKAALENELAVIMEKNREKDGVIEELQKRVAVSSVLGVTSVQTATISSGSVCAYTLLLYL